MAIESLNETPRIFSGRKYERNCETIHHFTFCYGRSGVLGCFNLGATEPSIALVGTVEAVSGDTVTIRLQGDFVPRQRVRVREVMKKGDQNTFAAKWYWRRGNAVKTQVQLLRVTEFRGKITFKSRDIENEEDWRSKIGSKFSWSGWDKVR